MVVRDILACAQPNCHKTFTALWNPYRRVSSRGQRAQIRYSRGVRGEKNSKQPSAILVLWRKYTEFRFQQTATIKQHLYTQFVGTVTA